MKNDIYLFGHHMSRPGGICRLATESFAVTTFVCQLAISGNDGVDEYNDNNANEIVATTYPQYGNMHPYKLGFYTIPVLN